LLDQISENDSDILDSLPEEAVKKEGDTSNSLTATSDNLWKDIPTGRIKTAMSGTSGEKKMRSIKKWLPTMDNPFWELYENKLRVNAADSGVCDLGSIE